jgi:hypothetical protein
MKITALELELRRWPYGLELQRLPGGLLLRPRRKARADWPKSFRRLAGAADDLAATRQVTNAFDATEWEW